jgi:hypothetical protein
MGVASYGHVRVGLAGGFAQLNHGKAGPIQRLKPGDTIIYYFTAIGEVLPGEPYEAQMSATFRAFRRDVRWRAAAPAPIHPLLDRLSFTKGRPSWGYAFRRGAFEITAEDRDLIATAMGAMAPA